MKKSDILKYGVHIGKCEYSTAPKSPLVHYAIETLLALRSEEQLSPGDHSDLPRIDEAFKGLTRARRNHDDRRNVDSYLSRPLRRFRAFDLSKGHGLLHQRHACLLSNIRTVYNQSRWT